MSNEDLVLGLEEVLEQHAYEEDAKPTQPTNITLSSSIKPVPPPAPLPRKLEPALRSVKVVYPPKESCYKCATILFYPPSTYSVQPSHHMSEYPRDGNEISSGNSDTPHCRPRRPQFMSRYLFIYPCRLMEMAQAAPGHLNQATFSKAGQDRYVVSFYGF